MKEMSCPNCQSDNIIKRGIRTTANRGKVQRLGCKDCSHRFVRDEGFWKMKNHEDKITACMNLYYSGMSLRKIQSHLQMFAPKNAHYSSIYRWIVKYANMISTITDKLPIQSGAELMSDEMEYSRLGRQNWFVDTLDTTTRFMVSSGFIQSRTNEELIRILREAKNKTNRSIRVITTDALRGYPAILRKTFNVNSKFKYGGRVVHNIVKADERGFNYKIERLHNTIRDRTKIMRGFHGSLDSAKAIMKGMEIYYNYVRKHQGIDNVAPQQIAMPALNLGVNKWLSLIKLAS
ncbi:MAG: DDE-type integrase/transposase/recombinase [Nanoarchaeota archaeon]